MARENLSGGHRTGPPSRQFEGTCVATERIEALTVPYEMEWSPAIVAEARQVIEQKYELIGRQTSGGAGMRAWRNNAKREYVVAVEGITFSHEGLDCRQDEREVSGADGPQMLPEAGNL